MRQWTVRGVRGSVSLNAVREQDGGFVVLNRTDPVQIDDPDTVRTMRSGMQVEKGDRFALQVEPGAGVGVRRGVDGAQTRTFTGPLHSTPRPPDSRSRGRPGAAAADRLHPAG